MCDSYSTKTYSKISRVSSYRCTGIAKCLHYNRESFAQFLGKTSAIGKAKWGWAFIWVLLEFYVFGGAGISVILQGIGCKTQKCDILNPHKDVGDIDKIWPESNTTTPPPPEITNWETLFDTVKGNVSQHLCEIWSWPGSSWKDSWRHKVHHSVVRNHQAIPPPRVNCKTCVNATQPHSTHLGRWQNREANRRSRHFRSIEPKTRWGEAKRRRNCRPSNTHSESLGSPLFTSVRSKKPCFAWRSKWYKCHLTEI